VQKAQPDEKGRLRLVYLLTLGRPPDDEEQRRDGDFLRQYGEKLVVLGVPREQCAERAWAALARTLFGRNEFLYVD
jgi:hypothetical protein